MISPLQFTCATVNSYLGTLRNMRGYYLRVVSCPTDAVLTFRFDGKDEIPYVPGETRRTPMDAWKTLEVKSTVAGVVLVTIGTDPSDRETTMPGILGGGSLLTIQGQYPNYTPAPVSPTTARFVTGGMLAYGGPGAGVSQPLIQAHTRNGDESTGRELGVGFGDTQAVPGASLAPNTSTGISTFGRGGVRFSVTIPTAGDVINFLGGPQQVPVRVWDSSGNIYENGSIRVSGDYFADILHLGSITWSAPVTNAAAVTLEEYIVSTLVPVQPDTSISTLVIDNNPVVIGAGSTLIIAGVARRRIRVHGYGYGGNTVANWAFQTSTGPAAINEFLYNNVAAKDIAPRNGWLFQTNVGDALHIFFNAATVFGLRVRYSYN